MGPFIPLEPITWLTFDQYIYYLRQLAEGNDLAEPSRNSDTERANPQRGT